MQKGTNRNVPSLALCCAVLVQLLLLGTSSAASAASPNYRLVPDRGFCVVADPTVTAQSSNFTPGMLVLFQFYWSHHYPSPPPDGGRLAEQVVKPDGTLEGQLRLKACGPNVPDGAMMTISLDEYFGSSHLGVPRTGQHLATITFTVDRSGPALPGLPNTGQGGGAAMSHMQTSTIVMGGALLAFLAQIARPRRKMPNG